MVKEGKQIEQRCGRCGGYLSFGIQPLKWNGIMRNNARIPHGSSVVQRVSVGGPCSPPVVPGPEDVPLVEKDFADFRILRLESCEMVNNVANRSRYGKDEADQCDDVDAS
jgi:hypothetical protein